MIVAIATTSGMKEVQAFETCSTDLVITRTPMSRTNHLPYWSLTHVGTGFVLARNSSMIALRKIAGAYSGLPVPWGEAPAVFREAWRQLPKPIKQWGTSLI